MVCHNAGSPGRSLGLPERQGTIVGGGSKERGWPIIGASFSAQSQVAGHHLYKLQGQT